MKIHAHDFCHLQHGYHPQIPEIIADLSPQVARVPSGVCIGENGRRMMEHRIASDGLSDHHRRYHHLHGFVVSCFLFRATYNPPASISILSLPTPTIY